MDPAAPLYPVVSIKNNCGNGWDSCKNVWNNCNISVSDEKRQVLEWLSPLASRERYQAVRDARAGGEGDWLLRTQKLSTWRTSEDRAAKPVPLCYGDPGVGKTYTSISSLVIDTPPDGIGVALTYVYCDYSARNVQSASTVLGSVLRQVVGALTQIPDEVQKAFEHAKRQKGFTCIEALDEFPTKQQAQLWDSLQRIVRECPNTRLFITGRPQAVTEVENYFPEDADMIIIKPTLGDIGRYIEKRLKEDLDLSAMDKELRANILRVIPERISWISLLVCINMDAIPAETTVHRRRQVLHRMTKGLGPQDAYSTTLGRKRLQGGGKSKLGMEALMWISRCERPLRSEELCHAL